MGRSAWPTILVVALLLSWLEPVPCAASSSRRRPRRRRPPRERVQSAGQPPPGSLPRRRGQPPAPATNAAPAAPRPAPASGRTLIVRAVDPEQAIVSMPENNGIVNLKAAPLEPTDFRFPINLATALRLADARPLIVAAAQASVWVAEAQLQRARVLWVPSLMTGFDYIRHDGGGPDFNKGIMTAPSVNFFYGGTGLWQYLNVTDAIFQPLAARQVLNARHWDIQTAKNDALMQTANAYFRVHQYRGMYAGTLYCVERGHDLVERIAHLSKRPGPAGRGRAGPQHARRPRAELRPGAAGVAGRQCRPHPAPAAGSPLGGRPARARPPADHPDRARPHARRPDADRPGQSPGDRHQAGADPGRGRGSPPREDAPGPARRHDQRLPGRRHVSSRPASSAWAPTAASTSGPAASTSAISSSGSSRPSASATWRGSRSSAARSRAPSSTSSAPRTWWSPT